MPKSAPLFAFIISLFATCLALADLPFSDEVFDAKGDCEEILAKRDVDAAGKAFLELFMACDPTDEDQLKLADAVEMELQNQLNSVLEIPWGDDEAREPYVLAFWKAVAAKYPEDADLQSRYSWAKIYSESTPWEEVQRLLIANGEMKGLRVGLRRLVEDPSLVAKSKPLVDAMVAFVPRAPSGALWDLLGDGSELGLVDLVQAVKARYRADTSPEMKETMAANYFQRVWHGLGTSRAKLELEELAARYDVNTLAPPSPAPSTIAGKGETSEAARLAGDIWQESLPSAEKSGAEDPRLWDRLGRYEALLETYPRYGQLYLNKAEVLEAAGFYYEAILTLEEGLGLAELTNIYELRAKCWKKLGGFELQALLDANRVLQYRVDEKSLTFFCQLALSRMLDTPAGLPAIWEPVVEQRLELLEERFPNGVAGALAGDAVAFWESKGRFARAKAALARYQSRVSAEVFAADERVEGWKARIAEALSFAVFNTLPDAPEPFGKTLEAAMAKGDLKAAWLGYQEWLKQDPSGLVPRLYGAAAFADLEAPYLALSVIEEAKKLEKSDEEAKELSRVKAFCHANLGEVVAAALAQADATSSDEISYYWLTAFVEANQMAVYRRVSERAYGIMNTERLDAKQAPWAWQTFVLTAPSTAVESVRSKWVASGGLPSDPEPLPLGLTLDVVESQRQFQVAWSDAVLARGEMSQSAWLFAAKLAAADGRDDDAAFAAARWLLGLESGAGEDAVEEKWAWETVKKYRDGSDPEEDAELALLRDPCNVEAMVRAYDAAFEMGDAYGAASFLRRLLMAYGESRIDLQAACNVAVAAADFELLLSLSQAALASDPSEENRGWYHLALVACGKKESAVAIGEQLFDQTLKGLTEDVGGWANFVSKTSRYVPSLKYGDFAGLHAAINDADDIGLGKLAEAAGLATDYDKRRIAELEPVVEKRLASASPSIRAHIRFQTGEIDAREYEDSLVEPEDKTFARIFTVLRRWKSGQPAEFEGSELADIQAILYDRGQHLRFRVMAYSMLRLAGVESDPAPLRASDALVLEDAPSNALGELRAGRLAMVYDSNKFLTFLGGNRSEKTYTLPNAPVVMQLGLAPDLPLVTMSGLAGENYPDRMRGFAEYALKPVITRAVENLDTELAAAGKDRDSRWQAYTRVGQRLKNLGKAFGADPMLAGEQVAEVMAPYVNANPSDGFIALMDTWVIAPRSFSKFNPEVLKTAKLGAQAYEKDYYDRLTTADGMKTGDSMKAAQKVVMDYPPGSSMYMFVMERLKAGVSPDSLNAAIEKENVRRAKVAEKENRVSSAIFDFERAMGSGNMRRAALLAQQLGGRYYVRWALRDSGARMDEIVYARSIATEAKDVAALTGEINRRSKLQQEQDRYARRWNAYGMRSSGGSSWDSFKASCNARSEAVAASQRARDAKNGIRWVKVND